MTFCWLQTLPKGRAGKGGGGQEEEGEEGGAAERERALKEELDAVQGGLDFLSGKRIGALVGMQADAIRGLDLEYEEHEKMHGERDAESAARNLQLQAFKRQQNGLMRQVAAAEARYVCRP